MEVKISKKPAVQHSRSLQIGKRTAVQCYKVKDLGEMDLIIVVEMKYYVLQSILIILL